MASSPNYLREASHASRALADTALDYLSDALLVVDAAHSHLPIVFINAAARECMGFEKNSPLPYIGSPLSHLLIDRTMLNADLLSVLASNIGKPVSKRLKWHLAGGEQFVPTELKCLPGAADQCLVMLSFSKPVAFDISAVIDQFPANIVILDSDLKIVYANKVARSADESLEARLIGCSGLKLAPLSIIHPDVFKRAMAGERFHDDALAFQVPGRATRWFDIDIQALNGLASTQSLLILYRETAAQHLHTRVQGGSERRMLVLTENARDIIAVTGAEGTLRYVSGGIRNSLGYTSEERESNNVFELFHPDDRANLRAQFENLVAQKSGSFSGEYRIRHKDGSYRWLESVYVSELENPLIAGIVINSRDITERKLAESKLAQREEIFRLAADAVDGVIFEWDIAKGTVHRSRGVQEVLGISPNDLDPSAEAWWERVHPRDYVLAKKSLSMALINGRGWTITYRVRDIRGCYRSILERAIIQRNVAGDPIRAIGCCVDVSEIKRLMDILAESQSIAKIGGWEYSYATRELTWTDEMFRIFDTNPGEFDVSWESMLAQCVPLYAQQLSEACRKAEASGGALDLELEVVTLTNQRAWVRMIGHLEMLDGRPFRSYGSMQSIQDQKVAQIELENTTGWLKLSMNMAHLYAWRWDKASDEFELATLEGTEVHLPIPHPAMSAILARVHPADRKAVQRAFDSAFTSRDEIWEEFRLLGNDGGYRAYDTTARPVFDRVGVPQGLVGVMQDVTDKRAAELRLRESEELLHATTANAADTLFLVDRALRVRFINKSVAALTVEQIIGQEVSVLLPAGARAGVVEKLLHILNTGETTTYEFVSLSSEGERHFENRAVLVQDDGIGIGIGTGISISMRDITDRKRLEKEILEISGRERESIGRDLHDGLGQELTGIALMLRGLAARIHSRCPDVVDNIDEVVGLVNQSIETARSLARGLLPVRTETGGLVFALRSLATRGRDLYGLDVNFRAEASRELTFSEAAATHLYRIAQEALTNAARHGRAKRVDIDLIGSANSFSLRISDDGAGFLQTMPTSAGMGLKIMKYRAGMIGAKFGLQSNVSHGTVVTVSGEHPP